MVAVSYRSEAPCLRLLIDSFQWHTTSPSKAQGATAGRMNALRSLRSCWQAVAGAASSTGSSSCVVLGSRGSVAWLGSTCTHNETSRIGGSGLAALLEESLLWMGTRDPKTRRGKVGGSAELLCRHRRRRCLPLLVLTPSFCAALLLFLLSQIFKGSFGKVRCRQQPDGIHLTHFLR